MNLSCIKCILSDNCFLICMRWPWLWQVMLSYAGADSNQTYWDHDQWSRSVNCDLFIIWIELIICNQDVSTYWLYQRFFSLYFCSCKLSLCFKWNWGMLVIFKSSGLNYCTYFHLIAKKERISWITVSPIISFSLTHNERDKSCIDGMISICHRKGLSWLCFCRLKKETS